MGHDGPEPEVANLCRIGRARGVLLFARVRIGTAAVTGLLPDAAAVCVADLALVRQPPPRLVGSARSRPLEAAATDRARWPGQGCGLLLRLPVEIRVEVGRIVAGTPKPRTRNPLNSNDSAEFRGSP